MQKQTCDKIGSVLNQVRKKHFALNTWQKPPSQVIPTLKETQLWNECISKSRPPLWKACFAPSWPYISPMDLLQVSSQGHYEDHLWDISLSFITSVQGRWCFHAVKLLSFIPPALWDFLYPVLGLFISLSTVPKSVSPLRLRSSLLCLTHREQEMEQSWWFLLCGQH